MSNIAKWGGIPSTDSGATYALTLGTQPGSGSFSVARYDDQISRVTAMTMETEVEGVPTKITLPNCVASDYTPKSNGNDGSFTFYDRRAFWAFLKPVQAKFSGTTKAIAIEILELMGEVDYITTGMPETLYEEEYTQPTNPAQMLADLCDDASCAVYLDPETSLVHILNPDQSLTNLDGFLYKKPGSTITGKGGVLPDSADIIGGYDINQVEVTDLVPVKINSAGKLEDITDIPGAITDLLTRFSNTGATGDNLKALARTVLKWFRRQPESFRADRLEMVQAPRRDYRGWIYPGSGDTDPE